MDSGEKDIHSILKEMGEMPQPLTAMAATPRHSSLDHTKFNFTPAAMLTPLPKVTQPIHYVNDF